MRGRCPRPSPSAIIAVSVATVKGRCELVSRSFRDARKWIAVYDGCPVLFSSPEPVSESLHRLSLVTTSRRQAGWYLDPRTATTPNPRFSGQVDPSLIRMTRFADAGGRSAEPWLEGRLDPAAGGGTMLTGRIGQKPGAAEARRAFVSLAGGVCLIVAAVGAAALASGRLFGLVFVLAPIAWFAGVAGINTANQRMLERKIPDLVQAVNETLGSTVACSGPDAQPGVCPCGRPGDCRLLAVRPLRGAHDA